MARPGAGSSRTKASSPPPGGAADLELTDDQRFALTSQHKNKYLVLHAAKVAADTALKNFGKVVKADLGEEGLADIKLIVQAKTPEGEAKIKAEVERQMRVLRWLGVAPGTQAGLFDEADRTPVVDRARAEGKRQGLAGETNTNPHHHTTEAHRAHNEGHAEGQAIVGKGFKPLNDTPKGSSPRDDGGLKDQIAKGDAIIDAGAKLGTQPSSFKKH